MNWQLFFLFLLAANFIIFINKPDLMFWSYLLMALDWGGYFSGYPSSYYYDQYFFSLFLPLLNPQIKLGDYIRHPVFKKFLLFLILFALLFHILIYGIISPYKDISNSLHFIFKHRLDIFGFLSIIPAYIFTVRNPKMLYKVIVIVSFIPLVLFIISLATGIDLLPIAVFERYRGSGIMRKSIRSYVFAQFLWSFVILLLLDRKNIKWKNIIYIGGSLMILIQVLTLTRRIIVFVVFQFLFTLFLHNKFFKDIRFSSRYIKIIGFIFFTFIIILFTFPSYLNYVGQGLQDVVDIGSTAKNANGTEDARVVSDIPQHIARFKENIFFGTGYDPIWYDSAEGLSANDTPITAALGMFGLVGFIYFGVFYIMIFLLVIKYFKKLKYRNRIYNLREKYYSLYLMVIGFFVLYLVKFTVYIPSLYLDLIMGKDRVVLMLYLGIFLGLLRVIDKLIIENKI